MPSRAGTIAILFIVLAGAATIIHGRLGDDDTPAVHHHNDSSAPGPSTIGANATTAPINATKTHTHIYFLLDRSGSMQSIASDVLGGFNAFVADQARDAAVNNALPTFLSLIQFDHSDPFEVCMDRVEITSVEGLTHFKPRGLTPLLDAIGSVIEYAAKDDDEATNKVVVIFSDGEENASRQHSRSAVNEMIEDKRKAGWAFVFLGANQDSYAEAGDLGVSRGSTQNFKFDSEGVKSAFNSLSRASSAMNEGLSMRLRDPEEGGGAAPSQAPHYKPSDFFAGVKEAEMDLKTRGA